MLHFIKNLYAPDRTWSTTKRGKEFTQEIQQQVWEKAKPIEGHSPNVVRRDVCGAVIRREDYGNTCSHYGWEIDHIKPIAFDGGDEIDNLQPLQWRNNRAKGDDFFTDPQDYCRVGEEKIYLP